MQETRETNTQNTRNTPITLAQRAPTRFITKRTWRIHLRFGQRSWEYNNILAQDNPCIRSQQGYESVKYNPGVDGFLPFEINASRGTFWHPGLFRIYLGSALARYGARVGDSQIAWAEATLFNQHTDRRQVDVKWGFDTRFLGITRTSSFEIEKLQRLFVVIGIFPRGYSNPREQIVLVRNPEKTLLGALLGYFSPPQPEHNGVEDLQLLLSAYKSWYVHKHISQAWAEWIHRTLNKSSGNLGPETYGLELVLGWSVNRISIVILFPVLLSLAVGLWLNSRAWTDLATIQTAWGAASYIVTTGGILAALLGILSSIDK
ncbi:hypothetical protein F4810DRAFT_710378 [Camillea tinctor]|nr:hypothetical protein F4810DRAFT_710378 [Camillea tinctor]